MYKISKTVVAKNTHSHYILYDNQSKNMPTSVLFFKAISRAEVNKLNFCHGRDPTSLVNKACIRALALRWRKCELFQNKKDRDSKCLFYIKLRTTITNFSYLEVEA